VPVGQRLEFVDVRRDGHLFADEKYDINSTISSAKGTVKAFNFPPHGNFLIFFYKIHSSSG
jgi:hypothetical protein